MKIVLAFILLFNTGCHFIEKALKKSSAGKEWLGNWERRAWQDDAQLIISAITNDSIQFAISSAGGDSLRTLNGWAIFKDGLAAYNDSTAAGTCRLELQLTSDSTITVKQSDCIYATGYAVTYDGIYKNEKLLVKGRSEPTLYTLGILNSIKQDSVFRSVTGSYYNAFLNSAQLRSEGFDIDSLHGTVHLSGVRGWYNKKESIVIANANNFWSAVIADNKVLYFTNSTEHTKNLPKAIDAWRENFSQYKVIYK